jgi:hypothetical protein
MASYKELLNDIPDEKIRSQMAALIGLGSALDDRFLDGLELVMDGLCPDCGERIETHEGEIRCHDFKPLENA